MDKSEDTTSGTTVAQTETSTESDKTRTRTPAGWVGFGDRGNERNNTRDSSGSTSKYYKRGIEAFGDMLALKYEKAYLKKFFDVFREKLINYTIKELNNTRDFIVLVQEMEDPKGYFDTKNEPKDSYKSEAKSEVKKYILATRVRQYIDREARLVYKIYGII